jgi:hypothetical protein
MQSGTRERSGNGAYGTFLWNMLWDDFGKYKKAFKLFRSPAGYLIDPGDEFLCEQGASGIGRQKKRT